jgi:hypothetical protein
MAKRFISLLAVLTATGAATLFGQKGGEGTLTIQDKD